MSLTTPVAAGTKIAGVKNAGAEEVTSIRIVIGPNGDTAVSEGAPLPVAIVAGGPTGGATETTLAALSGKLPASLGQKAPAGSISFVPASGVEFYPVTQPVSATALPLPAGAATAANQAAQKTSTDLTTPADDVFAISPSDSADLAIIPKALLCTVAGNVALRGSGGTAVTIPVVAGQIVPIRARRVMATNTTATVFGLV